MLVPTVNSEITNKIVRLLESSSNVLGLKLNFHDRISRSGLPNKWIFHKSPACKNNKKATVGACHQFCMIDVHTALMGNPEGRVHTCPFGITEIAVPVYSSGQFAGILFAGIIWNNETQKPHKDFVQTVDKKWLLDRRVMLKTIATELGVLLEGDQYFVPSARRKTILDFIHENMECDINLVELAAEIKLSPSRMGHVVRELFSLTFPKLVRSVKMNHASQLLLSTDLKHTQIATMVGIQDSNYFSYQFTKEMGMSPRQYKNKNKNDA